MHKKVLAAPQLCRLSALCQKKGREKFRECHNHKPQPFPDPKRKRKLTNPNKHKSNERTKSTISSLFPKRGNRNTKRTEKHKNKMTHGKTYNKSPRRINHKATKSKTNTGTTALERSRVNHRGLLQLANFTLGPSLIPLRSQTLPRSRPNAALALAILALTSSSMCMTMCFQGR